jgi:hypothetical protein
MTSPCKVLLLEFNEINERLMAPLLADGALPNFKKMRDEGASGQALATEVPPHLDPWVTWVTLHTGVERHVHGASVLEQKGESIQAKRTWQYARDAGRSLGIFGSITSYPPQPVPGFIVPGPFAPGGETYPKYLEPIQALNRRYTKVHNKLDQVDSPLALLKEASRLIRLGLSPVTAARVAAQLAREKVWPHEYWKRVSLQPLVNFDFFKLLYARYQPDYATFHSNHVAHYMHHYWRAHDDSEFLVRATAVEKRKYGKAVRYGYQVADALLGRFMKLVDDRTVLVVASSMGQKPYAVEAYREGRISVRFKDIQQILEMVGVQGVTETHAVMAPQWNVVIPDPEARRAAMAAFGRCERRVGGTTTRMGSVSETGTTLTVTPSGLSQAPDADMRFYFPRMPGDKPEGYKFDELFVADRPTTKQGVHDPAGVLMLWGGPIRGGVRIEHANNLDVAPTLLTLLGVPVPSVMTGRVLAEAWRSGSTHPRDNQQTTSSAVA